MARSCVEQSYALRPPRGELAPGEWRAEWPRSGFVVSCRLAGDGAAGFTVELRHNARGGLTQTVALAATRPHFSRGGSRWWFVCPGCGRRCGRLHLPYRAGAAGGFLCRRCHDLTYESSQFSRGFWRRVWLAEARRWKAEGFGCTYAQARDRSRLQFGVQLSRARVMRVPPRADSV